MKSFLEGAAGRPLQSVPVAVNAPSSVGRFADLGVQAADAFPMVPQTFGTLYATSGKSSK